ncbi:Hypothetical protein PAS_chr2-2_0006 [Komagataella phaffii GS115]|uniref:Uncharacterized protein n=1 Tax=Komagataella phaffii (strain GS115 / ATCC 20864) TaxID=644223 RepID=C4R356_KOMPG|nr:Hypothetical protein PAS_chr2-2_0006 [Komagataella phaffii GS115]CAY69930.1 Hypothetical protein PAS_chr2-2_0006 [Komagataella phaffii GS115]
MLSFPEFQKTKSIRCRSGTLTTIEFFLCGATAADNSLQKCEVQFLETETISDNVLLFNNTRDLGSNVRNAQYLCAESYYPLRVVLSSVLHNTLWIFRSS